MGGHDRGEGERWAERAREVLCTQITNVVADNDRLPIAFYPPICNEDQPYASTESEPLPNRSRQFLLRLVLPTFNWSDAINPFRTQSTRENERVLVNQQ